MAPNVVEERNAEGYVLEETLQHGVKTDRNYKLRIAWPQLIFHVTMHLCALYGIYIYTQAKFLTHVWGFTLGLFSGLAIAIGSHRGFSHRSYKATKAVQIFGLAFQTMAGQNSAYTWARDHRIHHKYSDTDADPHNINRGFLFAHIGWLVTKKHPLVIEKGRKIDVSDLRSNKLVMFQHRYFLPLWIVMGFIVPVCVPMYGWNETFENAFFHALCLRYVVVLNMTWCVNSVAHTFGMQPYDQRIRAKQSRFVCATTFGEGWHNFHHCFPWDYRSSEIGWFGMSTMVIDMLARFGFLYDLKTASPEIIHGHKARHGEVMQDIHNKQEKDGQCEKNIDSPVMRFIGVNST